MALLNWNADNTAELPNFSYHIHTMDFGVLVMYCPRGVFVVNGSLTNWTPEAGYFNLQAAKDAAQKHYDSI